MVTTMRQITAIAYNWRSYHNVGSLLRTAEGLGVEVILCGYTPYPQLPTDPRLPHLAKKAERQINKTALGAQQSVQWDYIPGWQLAVTRLKRSGYSLYAIEQELESISLPSFSPPEKLALVFGNEVQGLPHNILRGCKASIEIPMSGAKESFNVVQAAAMSLYHCRFSPFTPH